MKSLITDVPGVLVGNAHDAKLASGVTAVLFEQPAVASMAIHGGAAGVRDTALLDPEMTVERVDAFVLSGGSAFGLDAMGGAQALLRRQGRGFVLREIHVPIVPGAILFDLANGGDKAWRRQPPYWELGYLASEAACRDLDLGTVGAGFGATTANLKGGLGSASATSSAGYLIGVVAAVNGLGQATIGDGPHFWAAPFEREGEFGGLGLPSPWPAEALALRMKGDAPQNTTIAVVVTDASLTKPQARRLAVMAQDGMAQALRPSHAALDGDVVFAASTGSNARPAAIRDLTEIGMLAGDTLARAIARGVYHAAALPFPGALPAWCDKWHANIRPTA